MTKKPQKSPRFCVGFFLAPKLDSNQRPIRSEILSPDFAWSARHALYFFLLSHSLFLALRARMTEPVNSRMCPPKHKEPEKQVKKPQKSPRFCVGFFLAPQVGLEPTTLRLTAACSTDWAIEEYILLKYEAKLILILKLLLNYCFSLTATSVLISVVALLHYLILCDNINSWITHLDF